MIRLTMSAADLRLAVAQVPARAFGKHEIDQHRHHGYRQPARQCQKAKGIGVAGEQEGDKRHHGKRDRQRHLVDCPVGAPVLRRHQFRGDRKRRRYGETSAKPGQQTHDDQLLGVLHQRNQQCEKCRGDHADQHDRLAAPVIGYRRGRKAADAQHEGRADREPADVGAGQMQRRLGQHQERAGDHQIVALDKADEGEDGDDRYVVTAERDAVELASEHIAGRRYGSRDRSDLCHVEPPRLAEARRRAVSRKRRGRALWSDRDRS